MLIEGLPPGSAMHRKYPQSGGWDIAEHQRATQLDLLQALFHLTLAANSKEGRYDPPRPTERPGDAERAAAEARAYRRQAAAVHAIVAQLLPPDRR